MLNLDNDTIFLTHHESMDRGEMEELFAVKAIRENPDLLKNVGTFPLAVLALNQEIPNFDLVEIPDLLMVVVAVHKLLEQKLIPNTDFFGESIDKYIACCAWEEGWVILPRTLRFAQWHLDHLTSDHAHELFSNVSLETLESQDPWDDEDPVSLNCAKIQAVNHLLSTVE